MSGLFETPKVWQNLIASCPSAVMTQLANSVSNFLASAFVLVDSLVSTEAYLLTTKVLGCVMVVGVVTEAVVDDFLLLDLDLDLDFELEAALDED